MGEPAPFAVGALVRYCGPELRRAVPCRACGQASTLRAVGRWWRCLVCGSDWSGHPTEGAPLRFDATGRCVRIGATEAGVRASIVAFAGGWERRVTAVGVRSWLYEAVSDDGAAPGRGEAVA